MSDSTSFSNGQLQSSIQRLTNRLPIREYKFTGEGVRQLSESLFNVISTARLRLFPDAELESELISLNAVQKGYGWRIDHQSGGFSDRAMALGMMVQSLLANPPITLAQAIRFEAPSDQFGREPWRIEPLELDETVVMLKCLDSRGHNYVEGGAGGRQFVWTASGEVKTVPKWVADLLLKGHPTRFELVGAEEEVKV